MRLISFRPIFQSLSAVLLYMVVFSCQNGEKKEIPISKQNIVKTDNTFADENMFESLDEKLLLGRLFDNPEFDSIGFAVWKPNYEERMNVSLSDDKKCHTKVDTTIYFTDSQQRKCAVVVFGTYNFEKDDSNGNMKICEYHACGVTMGIAVFCETDKNQWRIYGFNKSLIGFGSFGQWKKNSETSARISLVKSGDNWTCVSFRNELDGNQGGLNGYETLISIEEYFIDGTWNEPLQKVFSYEYQNSQEEMAEEGLKSSFEKSKIKFVPGKKRYYNILKSTDKNDIRVVKTYSFYTEVGKYIPID